MCNYDYCEECRIYCDDYHVDENGEWIDACENCFMNTENIKNKGSERMRKPKVENKYNLTMKKINKLMVGDESKIKEPLFWRNNVINAWCISGTVGTYQDREHCTDNEFWIGIYDKSYYNSRIRVYCNCLGGMCTYKFNKFFRSEDIEHENDLKVQEELLRTVNHLIDEGILVVE